MVVLNWTSEWTSKRSEHPRNRRTSTSMNSKKSTIPDRKSRSKTILSNLGKLSIYAVLLLVFARYTKFATEDVAFQFGWIIGASKSPISATVAPLVFGLLGAAVLATVSSLATKADAVWAPIPDAESKKARPTHLNLWISLVFAIALMMIIQVFISHTRRGIVEGQTVISDQNSNKADLPKTN